MSKIYLEPVLYVKPAAKMTSFQSKIDVSIQVTEERLLRFNRKSDVYLTSHCGTYTAVVLTEDLTKSKLFIKRHKKNNKQSRQKLITNP